MQACLVHFHICHTVEQRLDLQGLLARDDSLACCTYEPVPAHKQRPVCLNMTNSMMHAQKDKNLHPAVKKIPNPKLDNLQ